MPHVVFDAPQPVWCPITVEMVTELSKNELLLWTALHQFGADWGRATPSVAVVCQVTGLSETRLHVAKRGLIDKGYLAVEAQYSEGRQTWNRYVARKAPPGWRVLPDATPEPAHQAPAVRSGEGAGNRQGRVPVLGTPGVPVLGTPEGAAFRHPDYTETNTHSDTEEPPLPPTGGPGVGAHPLQPNLLPIDTPVAKPVPPAKTRPRSTPSPIPPDFAHLSELISAWLEMRLQVNPRTAPRIDPWGPRQKSASALRLAIAKGVAVPFLEMAAERGWVSLGHAGHSADIDRLASPSAPRSNRWAPPEPPVLQDYKPGRR